MEALPSVPANSKLLAASSVKMKLGTACLAILVLGGVSAPRRQPAGLTAPQEHAAPLLEEQVQPARPAEPFSVLGEAAVRVQQWPLAVGPPLSPGTGSSSDFTSDAELVTPGYAVRVSATHALSHIAALGGRPSVSLIARDGRRIEAVVVVFDPETGLVLLETPAAPERVPVVTGRPVSAGALVMAVGYSREREHRVPLFVVSSGPDRIDLGGSDTSLESGMPVHDLEGALVGIVADRSSGYAIPIARAVARTIPRASTRQRLGAIGITFQPFTPALRPLFGEKGVLISDAVTGAPANAAGIRAGDVLLAVDTRSVDSPAAAVDALRQLQPGSTTVLTLNRRGREMEVTVAAATAYEVAARARKIRVDASSLPHVSALFDQSSLDAAVIPDSARVLSINWKRLTSKAQVDRERRAARGPLPIHLLIGDAVSIVALEPGR